MSILLLHTDNMDFMRDLGDNFFDLAMPDLEYGIGASKPSTKSGRAQQPNGTYRPVKQAKYKHKDWDDQRSPPEYFDELFRVSKNQIIWGANYYPNLVGGRIVWDKIVANGADQYGCEIAYQSFSNRMDIVYYMFSGMMQGVYCGKDRVKALKQQGNKKLNEKRIHPTQKPVKLYEWLLMEYAKPGEKILDTHGGSMSLALAVNKLNVIDNMNLTLVVCEKDIDYFTDGQKRYNDLKINSLFNDARK